MASLSQRGGRGYQRMLLLIGWRSFINTSRKASEQPAQRRSEWTATLLMLCRPDWMSI